LPGSLTPPGGEGKGQTGAASLAEAP